MGSALRVRDLLDAADARAFAEPDAIGPERLPLPCRAVRLPASRLPSGRRPQTKGAVWIEAPRGSILAGPRDVVRQAAETLPASLGRELTAALERYDRPAESVRFADGSTWDLSERSRVLGVLNVTPDSFSDGGRNQEPGAAVLHAERMLVEGADAIDVGGESTRPGSAPVDPEEERRRVVPVIRTLRERFPGAVISIDTRRSDVAAAALDEGADLVNDVSGLSDPAMAPLIAARGCPVVVMHMRGTPETMQRDTRYEDLVGEILDGLSDGLETARASGIAGDRLLVDPGIGFGKSVQGNGLILRQLDTFRSLGHPILVGVSRKSFIGQLTGVARADSRLAGSLAAATAAVLHGAAVIRAHDVGPTREALAVADALRAAGRPATPAGGTP